MKPLALALALLLATPSYALQPLGGPGLMKVPPKVKTEMPRARLVKC